MRSLFLLLLLVAAPLAAQSPRDLTVDELQRDFDVLRRAVEEAHGGLYRFTAKPTLDKVLASSRSRLTEPMSSLQFAAVVSEALAAVRDGHMRLEYDSATMSALSAARTMPLRVANEGGRLVVTRNDTSSDATIRPGMELISVNGRPIASIVATIAPKISGDGFIETGRAWRLARSFASYYWLYVERTATFTVEARSPSGQTMSATLTGVNAAERRSAANPVNAAIAAAEATLDGPADTVALSFLDGGDVGLLRIRAFDGGSFIASLQQSIATLNERRATGLVLDLRGNGGGVDNYGAVLVAQFVREPFRYFDHIKVTTVAPSFATWKASTFDDLKNGTAPAPDGGFLVLPRLHPNVAMQRPADRPFLGKLAVLIDGGTFSTAADAAAQLRSRTNAVFIGEETGGAAEGNTSGLNAEIVLPTSQLKLKIQMYGYWNALGPLHPEFVPRGRGTMPDVTVVRTVADTLAGVDAGMQAAILALRR